MSKVRQKLKEHQPLSLSEKKEEYNLSFLLKSNLAWLLIALLTVEAILHWCHPLRMVQVQGTMLKEHDIIGGRVNRILQKPHRKNSIIVGDSTADGICYYADLKTQNLKLDTLSHFQYLDAKTGESTLKQYLNISVSLQNMTFGGCLMQDQALICRKYLESGPAPQLALLTVVPRPFFDTTVDERISPVKCYFDNRHKSIADTKNFSKLFDYVLSEFSNAYRTRSDYATVLCSLACSNLNRPLSAYENNQSKGLGQRNTVTLAGAEKNIIEKEANNLEETRQELTHYTEAYKFNQDLFNRQFGAFETMVSELRKRGTEVIILKFPLSPLNLSLIDPDKLRMLNEKLKQCAFKNDSTIIDFQISPDFTMTDYRDGVHLNGSGSIKFWDKLASTINKNSALKQRLLNRFQ